MFEEQERWFYQCEHAPECPITAFRLPIEKFCEQCGGRMEATIGTGTLESTARCSVDPLRHRTITIQPPLPFVKPPEVLHEAGKFQEALKDFGTCPCDDGHTHIISGGGIPSGGTFMCENYPVCKFIAILFAEDNCPCPECGASVRLYHGTTIDELYAGCSKNRWHNVSTMPHTTQYSKARITNSLQDYTALFEEQLFPPRHTRAFYLGPDKGHYYLGPYVSLEEANANSGRLKEALERSRSSGLSARVQIWAETKSGMLHGGTLNEVCGLRLESRVKFQARVEWTMLRGLWSNIDRPTYYHLDERGTLTQVRSRQEYERRFGRP
jgi:ssDNA-binding Zn-finger/Zn-ribbon topoisomerase 1